jgi:hypothetical protein
MSKGAPTLTKDEFIAQVRNVGLRLTSHLDHLDSGDLALADDVATVTRILLGPGAGNNAIIRLCRQNHLEEPTLLVGPSVEIEKGTVFAVGSIPTPDEGATNPEERSLSLNAWLSSMAVISASAARWATTWSQLVADFGNTWGAHLSPTMPDVLVQAKLFGAVGGDLRTYLLRAAAIVAERSLQELLPQVGAALPDTAPRKISNDGMLEGLWVKLVDHAPALSFGFMLFEPKVVEVFRSPLPVLKKVMVVRSRDTDAVDKVDLEMFLEDPT